MSQFEQENDLGRGGGEVDAETLGDAWKRSEDLHNAPVDPETGMTRRDEDEDEDERPD